MDPQNIFLLKNAFILSPLSPECAISSLCMDVFLQSFSKAIRINKKMCEYQKKNLRKFFVRSFISYVYIYTHIRLLSLI
jgi:hypothetical protein